MPALLTPITQQLTPAQFVEAVLSRRGYHFLNNHPYGGISLQFPQQAYDAPTAEDRAIREYWKKNERDVAALALTDRRTCYLGPKPGSKSGGGGSKRPHTPTPHHPPASGLKRAAAPRQKVGHDRDGRPLSKLVVTVPPPPEPPPPPPPADPVGSVSPCSLIDVSQCDAMLATLDRAFDTVNWSYERLPAETDDESPDTRYMRVILRRQLNKLAEYHQAVRERRSELFMQHVDRCARERQMTASGGRPRV